MKKILSNELGKYDDEVIVFVPRVSVSCKIVKLQNSCLKTTPPPKNLTLLIDSVHSQAKQDASKRRFVKMSKKIAYECFKDEKIPVYIDV